MHETICDFPSDYFYKYSALKDEIEDPEQEMTEEDKPSGLITSDFIKKRPLPESFAKLEERFKRVVFIDLLHSIDKDGLMRCN